MNTSIEWVDTHCHLNYDYDGKTSDDLVSEASDAGVKTLITIGCDWDAHSQVVTLSERHPQIYHTIGFHPHEAEKVTQQQMDTIRFKAKHPKCKALGEMGLDYYYEHSPRDIQQARFEEQLNLALELRLPVVIHSRDGEDDLIPLLDQYVKKTKGLKHPGVLHCFSGTETLAKKCLDWGFLISLSGILTFKSAENLRQIVRTLPLASLMVETDAPYLAPTPFRGKKCEPKMTANTGVFLAQLLNLQVEKVAESTTRNARRLFDLPDA